MRAVNLADMLISLYRIKLGTRKWYHHIVYYCISVAVINGWILYKRHVTQNGVDKKRIMYLLDFQSRIAGSLLQEKKMVLVVVSRTQHPESVGAPMPADEIRYDCVDHFPVFEDKQMRCKNCCNGSSFAKCNKCDKHLCFVAARNCFWDFHKK